MRAGRGWFAAALIFAAAGAATAQEISRVAQLPPASADVERVRTLYGAAAYEEALAAMPPAIEGALRTDIEQYRALCLLALGREREAVAVVERLVSDNPMFIPPDVETTPRLRAIFAAARSKLVPGLAKRSYAEAKVAFESRNHEEAQAGFKRTVDLIDTLSENERAPLSDLRLLAGEFLKLSVPLPAPAGPSEPTKPLLDSAPTRTAGGFIGPIPMREQLPAWVPPDGPARRTEYSGLLRVEIDADGRVTSATIVKASHPAYDAAAVTAARQWVYRPATRGGQPVPSSKEISLRLVPQ